MSSFFSKRGKVIEVNPENLPNVTENQKRSRQRIEKQRKEYEITKQKRKEEEIQRIKQDYKRQLPSLPPQIKQSEPKKM